MTQNLSVFISTVIIIGIAACNPGSKPTPNQIQIDQKKNLSESILISSGSIKKAHKRDFDGIVVLAVEEAGELIYRQTENPKFKTDEGISVGMHFREIKKKLTAPPRPFDEPGWFSHFELPSGWNVAFALDTPDFQSMVPDSTVVLLFKRGL